MRLGEEVSLLCGYAVCALGRVLLSCAWKGRQEGADGSQAEGWGRVILNGVRLIFPNLTLARVYWPILKSCSNSVLMKLLK